MSVLLFPALAIKEAATDLVPVRTRNDWSSSLRNTSAALPQCGRTSQPKQLLKKKTDQDDVA
jgi:hypothetical protein